jgi:hypothetical protein
VQLNIRAAAVRATPNVVICPEFSPDASVRWKTFLREEFPGSEVP